MFNEHAILNELNPLLREKVINYNCRSLVKVRFHWSSAFSCLWFVHQWKLWKVCWFFECCWHWFRFGSHCKAEVWSLFAGWWDYPRGISRKSHVLYQLGNSSSYDEKRNETKISIRYNQFSTHFWTQNWSHLNFKLWKFAISEGEHFGEICLFVSNLKRTASIIATTNVSVYILRNESN